MTDQEKMKRTKALLKRYRTIRAACSQQQIDRAAESAAYSESLEWFNRLMRGKDPDAIIERVQHTSDRTADILAVIDHAINDYRAGAADSLTSWRPYDILFSAYLSGDPGRLPDLCQKWQCSRDTLYRDLRQAAGAISSKLFPD